MRLELTAAPIKANNPYLEDWRMTMDQTYPNVYIRLLIGETVDVSISSFLDSLIATVVSPGRSEDGVTVLISSSLSADKFKDKLQKIGFTVVENKVRSGATGSNTLIKRVERYSHDQERHRKGHQRNASRNQ